MARFCSRSGAEREREREREITGTVLGSPPKSRKPLLKITKKDHKTHRVPRQNARAGGLYRADWESTSQDSSVVSCLRVVGAFHQNQTSKGLRSRKELLVKNALVLKVQLALNAKDYLNQSQSPDNVLLVFTLGEVPWKNLKFETSMDQGHLDIFHPVFDNILDRLT